MHVETEASPRRRFALPKVLVAVVIACGTPPVYRADSGVSDAGGGDAGRADSGALDSGLADAGGTDSGSDSGSDSGTDAGNLCVFMCPALPDAGCTGQCGGCLPADCLPEGSSDAGPLCGCAV